jgi:anaerobic magnesium-protoporphyrin IX monomethyl ester cyclase
MKKYDIVFVNPGDRKEVYQGLGSTISAIEPPFLTASFAAYLRNEGFNVSIIDANALNMSPQETAELVKELDPLLVAIIVYGNQPSASTQNMPISGRLARAIKKVSDIKIVFAGLHPSALPQRTLEEESIDFVIEGEEQVPLKELVTALKETKELSSVSGLWYYDNKALKNNPKHDLYKELDAYLPIAAWDLLPMDKYRAHNWHCFDRIHNRMPYAAIYTSLGCPYKCTFCCINTPFGKSTIRYRNPELVIEEIGILVEKYGVKNLKIIDEMFVLEESHYMKIVDYILEKGYDLNMWAYARIDTIKKENLAKMKAAGFNWLGIGIESANAGVRDGASKKMRVKDIQNNVRMIQESGIYVGANYIFGLQDDTLETMQETLDLAKELNTEFANFYCAMAYPGSPLYKIALNDGLKLPDSWIGFSQHAYDMQPLPSKYLAPKEIVKFRDNAFHEYFENPAYLDMLEAKFGKDAREHIEHMTKTRLKRKLLEEK